MQETPLARRVSDRLSRRAKPTIGKYYVLIYFATSEEVVLGLAYYSGQSSARDIGRSPERSHTVPALSRPSVPLPLRRSRTTSRLGALQQAYAEVTDDASQIPVEDLVQATKLVHQDWYSIE